MSKNIRKHKLNFLKLNKLCGFFNKIKASNFFLRRIKIKLTHGCDRLKSVNLSFSTSLKTLLSLSHPVRKVKFESVLIWTLYS